jgi:hypothetical protein
MEQTTTTTTTPGGNPNAGKGMGIAGLVLGILAAIFSFVPCLGMWAIVPGIIGLILSVISMKQAGAAGAPKGMAIGGLITSIVGIAIACYWIYAVYFAAGALVDAAQELERSGALDSLNKAMEQLKNVTDTMQQH